MDCIRFEVGSRIRQIRLKKKLSQERLAELSDLNPSYIGQIERGEKNPSIETVYKICTAMNTNMSALFENLTSSEGIANQYPQAVYSIMLEMDEPLRKSLYDVAVAVLAASKKSRRVRN